MIGCERCHKKEVPLSVVEARSYVDGSIKEWEICDSCYGYFLELMNIFIHTTKLYSDGESSTLA